jgi:hypothetical protein
VQNFQKFISLRNYTVAVIRPKFFFGHNKFMNPNAVSIREQGQRHQKLVWVTITDFWVSLVFET